ncbi:MAG: Nif11-like leader peptide family natural product precursor [Atopobiaceae bacterium]|nr:Nif11-like leader peptide family natural product precursor [Atopobiaceae bacterium]
MDIKGVSESVRKRAQECKTPAELLELAQQEGYELSDEELEAVSGGDRGVWIEKDNCTLCKGACNDLY